MSDDSNQFYNFKCYTAAFVVKLSAIAHHAKNSNNNNNTNNKL